jgi:shikimate kinase
MRHLAKLGPRIYLKVELGELKKRLPDWSNRGVVCRGGSTLPALFRERTPLFRKYADLKVDTRRKTAEKIAKEILDHFFKKVRD